MNFLTFLLTFAAMLGLSSAIAEPEAFKIPGYYRQICNNKNPSMVVAIQNFCVSAPIIVPSPYAKKGVCAANNMCAKIGRPSNCNPKTKLSRAECERKFFQVCAKGGKKGRGWGKGGPKKCQTFRTYSPSWLDWKK